MARSLPGWLSALWAVLLPVLLLGPALGAGYVLRADMVWVPDLALNAQALGLTPELPRAVPSDAVVAVVDEVLGGMLTQKLVLLGSLVAAGLGIRALVPASSPVGRLVAVSAYVWNPFVAERLLMGHWPVLAGYAALPWLVHLSRSSSRQRWAGYCLALPLGSLSAGAGLVSALVALVTAWPRGTVRQRATLLGVVAAANAPWLLSGLAHAGAATSATAGAHAFATRSWGVLPTWLQVLDLGGIWNSDSVLDSRRGPLAVLSVLAVVALAWLGRRVLAGWLGRPDLLGVVALAALGLGLALVSAYLPGVVGALSAAVPGGGLLRDGSRFLALAAPAVALGVAAGAERVVRLGPGAVARGALSLGVVLLPVMLLPDLAWGASGRLDAVDYPQDLAGAREAVAASVDAGAGGDLLLMPFSAYRAPAWNEGRKVLDPIGRYLGRPYVSNDALIVGDSEIVGEDPRARAVLRALGAPTPAARSEGLAAEGISLVARTRGADVDRITGPKAAALAGEVLWSSEHVEVLRLDGRPAAAPRSGTVATVLVAAGWAALGGCVGLAAVLALIGVSTLRRSSSAAT